MKTTKLIILGISISLLMSTCVHPVSEIETTYCDKWVLFCYYDNGFSKSTVICDSLNMNSNTEAIVWISGKKTRVIGEELRPLFIPCK